MITPYFARSEFTCRCGCGLADPHPALVVGLQELREIIRVPIQINSGSRCTAHNAAVGGAPSSMHLPRADLGGYTCAADITTSRPLIQVYDFASRIEWFAEGGIAAYVRGYAAWLHLDVRGVLGLREPWRQGYTDGHAVSIEAALMEDERRRALKSKEAVS